MKKVNSLIALSALLVAIQVSAAHGAIAVNDRIVFSNVFGTNQGMMAKVYQPAGISPANYKGGFITFCVEGGDYASGIEYVSPDATNYVVGALTDNVTVMAANIVTDGAKWLYRQYLDGTLSALATTNGTSFNAGSGADMGELQRAIWSLTTLSDATTFLTTVNGKAAAYRSMAVSLGTVGNNQYQVTSLAYSVGVLNPYTTEGKKNVQSFLYEVPEPAALVAWSVLSLVGLGVIRRNCRGK